MTLKLGALSDGGTGRTITKSGNAALTLTSAGSLGNGTAVNITGGYAQFRQRDGARHLGECYAIDGSDYSMSAQRASRSVHPIAPRRIPEPSLWAQIEP